MKPRILVTGGSGGLGKQLLPRLKQEGYRLRVTSRSERPETAGSELEWTQAALESADGWQTAVQGVDTVVHLASAPFQRGLDVSGTRHLLAAAREADVRHVIYISIVGVDRRDWFYYQAKHDCERLIAASGLPYSILRATQFHDFAGLLLSDLFLRGSVGWLPRGWRMQPIEAGEVAQMLAEAVDRGPGGHLPDAGGPQVLRFEDMAAAWMDVFGRRRVLRLPFPFLMGSAFSKGHNLAPDDRRGRRTWQEWLAAQQADLPRPLIEREDGRLA